MSLEMFRNTSKHFRKYLKMIRNIPKYPWKHFEMFKNSRNIFKNILKMSRKMFKKCLEKCPFFQKVNTQIGTIKSKFFIKKMDSLRSTFYRASWSLLIKMDSPIFCQRKVCDISLYIGNYFRILQS